MKGKSFGFFQVNRNFYSFLLKLAALYYPKMYVIDTVKYFFEYSFI